MFILKVLHTGGRWEGVGKWGEGVGDFHFLPFWSFPFMMIFTLLFNWHQVITRANLAAKKIITIMVFTLIGCALCFMGLEIDLAVVLTCIKVSFLKCKTRKSLQNDQLTYTITSLSETNWSSNRAFLPVHHHAVQRLLPRLALPRDQLREAWSSSPWKLARRGQLQLLGEHQLANGHYCVGDIKIRPSLSL